VKICWDNLEKFNYESGFFYRNDTKSSKYIESDYVCYHCKENFIDRKNLIINNISKFCSKECKNNNMKYKKPWNYGKSNIYTEETKIKIGLGHKNKKISNEHKNKISISERGRVFSEEHKAKLGKGGYAKNNKVSFNQFENILNVAHIIRRSKEDQNILETKCTYCNKWYEPTYREVNNRINAIYHHGDGGRNLYCSNQCKQECPTFARRLYPKGFKPVTSREVQPELRKLVFERDNWSCVKCGIGENLHCHHIDPVVNNPLESADIDNCITLCKSCHKKVHKKGGCKYGELKC